MSAKINQWKNFSKGLVKENPALVLMLGMCPTLAVTSSAINGLGMGLATTFVLVLSNMLISAIKTQVPDKVRIPCFIVVIAAFVTVVDLLIKGFVPALGESLGVFIPLIVVNCIVLGRAEAFASKNGVFSSLIDGLGMGLGFTFALTILGIIREVLGAGAIFGNKFIDGDGIIVFILAPGAFIVLGFLVALVRQLSKKN
ncbi:MAG: electron transport complex subunit E [Lentimicrobiaceae bacterium]|nr:electron transport complex subunit E [Lentimicrobiaceae bacterium]